MSKFYRANVARRLALIAPILLIAAPALAAKVGSVVRVKGSETSELVGMGLVVGLDNTGDGGDFAPAHRPLVEVISKLIDDQTTLGELDDAKSVALVALSATIPAEGVAEGDKLDVYVSTVGPAKSLEGGRLFLIPMLGEQADSDVLALASGEVTLENPEVPTTGRIAASGRSGAKMTRTIRAQYIDSRGYVQLVINPANASFSTATNLAGLINSLVAPDGPDVARAVDEKNVYIRVPEYERANPAVFVNLILDSYIDASQVTGGARVVINQRTGTIVMSGDVEVSPTLISHDGLTVSMIEPAPLPELVEPRVVENNVIAIDPADRGGPRLAELLEAFNQLKVPAEDRIQIIRQMHDAGQLHAELVLQ